MSAEYVRPCPTCGGRRETKAFMDSTPVTCTRCAGTGEVRAYPLDHTTPELEAWLAERRDPSWQPPAPPKAPRFPYGLKRITRRGDGLHVGAMVTLRRDIVGLKYDEHMPADVAAWQIVCEGGSGSTRTVGLLADDGSQRWAIAYAYHVQPLAHEAVA